MERNTGETGARRTAEQARAASDAAIEQARLNAELVTAEHEAHIEAEAKKQRAEIDIAISQATNEGRTQVHFTYTERISASRKPKDEITLIEETADKISGKITEDLKNDGYRVSTFTAEVIDFRDGPEHPPEYYDTYITISW